MRLHSRRESNGVILYLLSHHSYPKGTEQKWDMSTSPVEQQLIRQQAQIQQLSVGISVVHLGTIPGTSDEPDQIYINALIKAWKDSLGI